VPNSRETLLNFPFRLILLCSLEWDPDPKTLTVETNPDPGKLYGSPTLINISIIILFFLQVPLYVP
jgi:hypothetical protein